MIKIDLDAVNQVHIGIFMHQRLGPEWAWDHYPRLWARGPALLLWLVRDGAADLHVDSQYYQAVRGDFFIMPALEHTYHGRHNPANPFEVSWMFFSFLDSIGNPIPVAGVQGIPFTCRLSDIDAAVHIMDRVLETTGPIQEIWLLALLDEVRRQHRLQEADAQDAGIAKLVRAIQQNPALFSGLEEMRTIVPVSRDHLIRLFRRRMGVTPVEFLIRTKIDHAKGKLLMSSYSIKEIAYALGYSDQFVFSRQFRERTGVSPREFRRGNRIKSSTTTTGISTSKDKDY